jgi:hypothetical protein
MQAMQKKKLHLKKESLRCLSALLLSLVAGGTDGSSGELVSCDEVCTFTVN